VIGDERLVGGSAAVRLGGELSSRNGRPTSSNSAVSVVGAEDLTDNGASALPPAARPEASACPYTARAPGVDKIRCPTTRG